MTVKAFIARLAQYPEDALCCGTFWLAGLIVSVSRSAMRDCVPADADADVDVLLPLSRKKPLPGVLSAVMLRTEPASLSPPGPAVNRRAAGVHPDARAGLQTPPAESPPLSAPWPALTAPRQNRRAVRRNAVSLVAPVVAGVPALLFRAPFHRLSPFAREYPATTRLAVQYR